MPVSGQNVRLIFLDIFQGIDPILAAAAGQLRHWNYLNHVLEHTQVVVWPLRPLPEAFSPAGHAGDHAVVNCCTGQQPGEISPLIIHPN